MTTTIKFVRVERDCNHNKNLRADGEARGIIYDFDVMIDGEKRAEMQRDYTGKGYHLQDADGRPIEPPLAHYRTGREVASKSEFLTIVSELLETGKIPTLADMAAKREAEAQVKRDKIAAKKEEQRRHAISANAEALYSALSELLRCASIPEGWEKDARDVMNMVDKQAAEWMVAVDADPGRFNIY